MTNTTPNLCKDCKHGKKPLIWLPRFLSLEILHCTVENAKQPLDLVTGKQKKVFAELFREFGECGKDGQFFTPRG